MLIVAGEALIDMTPITHNGGMAYMPHPGGSPYNVAIGAGRLGTPTAFLGCISRDAFGQLLRSHLAASGVSLDYLKESEHLTTLALVTPSESGEFFPFTVKTPPTACFIPKTCRPRYRPVRPCTSARTRWCWSRGPRASSF